MVGTIGDAALNGADDLVISIRYAPTALSGLPGRDCPLRSRCTSETGSELVLHPGDDLLRPGGATVTA